MNTVDLKDVRLVHYTQDLYFNKKRTSEHLAKDFLAGVKAAQVLSETVNGGNANAVAEGFLAELHVTHRYLQNEVIWSLIRVLTAMASEGSDARNETAIQACQKMLEADVNPLPKLEVKS